LTYAPLEIIVVDNYSEDDTQQMITLSYPFVRYIRTNKNIGTAARNLAMKSAEGSILITLDDDILGIKDADIHSLVRLFCARPLLGAVNFRVLSLNTGRVANWVHHCQWEHYHTREFLTYEITEGAVAFRKAAVKAAGFYPTSFFISHEGPALALRILDAGFQVIYSPLVTVNHVFAEEGRPSWRRYYYDTRNQVWLAARCLPLQYACMYLLRGLFAMLIYAVRDGFVSSWLKGLVDGLAGLGQALRERRVLTAETMRIVKTIDSMRPPLRYMIARRLFRKGIDLT
jgi:GT2 family glycosyltransferase